MSKPQTVPSESAIKLKEQVMDLLRNSNGAEEFDAIATDLGYSKPNGLLGVVVHPLGHIVTPGASNIAAGVVGIVGTVSTINLIRKGASWAYNKVTGSSSAGAPMGSETGAALP